MKQNLFLSVFAAVLLAWPSYFYASQSILPNAAIPQKTPLQKENAPVPDWDKVQSVDDFFDEYVVRHPIAKKLITDRYINYLHDKFPDAIKKINPDLDTIFSPTDWIQAVDHAANGEFKQLEIFAAEAFGKKIIETIFPVGGTLLTQAYDYAKMVSAEVQAWGNNKDVQIFIKGYMSQQKASWTSMKNYRDLSVAWLNSSFNREWGEARQRYGWSQWTKSRDQYLDKELRVQCWEALMNLAATFRKHLREKEALRFEARAEQQRMIEKARQEYRKLNQISKILYYAGICNTTDINKNADDIKDFTELDRTAQNIFIDSARKRYAAEAAEGQVKKIQDIATRYWKFYDLYTKENAVQRLLAFPEPDYAPFYAIYPNLTKKLLAGRLTAQMYWHLLDSTKKAYNDITHCTIKTVEDAMALIKKMNVYEAPEIKADKKGLGLRSELTRHNAALLKIIDKEKETVAQRTKEKLQEYKDLVETSGPDTPGKTTAKERAAFPVPGQAPPAQLLYLADVRPLDLQGPIKRLPQPNQDFDEYTQTIDQGIKAVEHQVDLDLEKEKQLMRENYTKTEAMNLARKARGLQEWVSENQHWADLLSLHIEDPEIMVTRAIDMAARLRKTQMETLGHAEYRQEQKYQISNVQSYFQFIAKETDRRMETAQFFSEAINLFVQQYVHLLSYPYSHKNKIPPQEIQDLKKILLERPDDIALPHLDMIFAHLEEVIRDRNAGGYDKILAEPYKNKNIPGIYFFKIISNVNIYSRWDLKKAWFEEQIQHFKDFLHYLDKIESIWLKIPESERSNMAYLIQQSELLQKSVVNAPLQGWENQIVEQCFDDSLKAKKIIEYMALVQKEKALLKAGVEVRNVILNYMTDNEPRHQEIILNALNQADKLKNTDRSKALSLAEKAYGHCQFVLYYVPFCITDLNSLYVRSKALIHQLKGPANHAIPGVQDFINKTGTLKVTLNRGPRAKQAKVAITITDIRGKPVAKGPGPHVLDIGSYRVITRSQYMETDPSTYHLSLNENENKNIIVRVWQEDDEVDDPVTIKSTQSATIATPAHTPEVLGPEQSYQKYIYAYNKLTKLMSEGQGDTPQAQQAYAQYKKAKDAYEAQQISVNPQEEPSSSEPLAHAKQENGFQLGSAWRVEESCPGQRWVGTWTKRPGTQIFDATWTQVQGPGKGMQITDVIEFKALNNGTITLFRHGTNGNYTGQVSGNGKEINNGYATWYHGKCFWKAEIGHTTLEPMQDKDSTSVSITNFDFESGTLAGWTKSGEAFNSQPTYGDNPTARRRGQPSKHQGNYWIGTFEKRSSPADLEGKVQGDGPQGTLTSEPFTIKGTGMSFLIGGGCNINMVRVELLVNDKVVLKETGKCTETMHQVNWDVSLWRGKTARIRLIDGSSGGWGHINFDYIRQQAKGQ